MKYDTSERLSRRVSTATAITFATALLAFSSYASELDPSDKLENTIPGLDQEQMEIIAEARKNQSAAGYSKQEEAAIDLAIAKVSEMTPVSKDSISNIRIRSIQWPDSSLGCAEPGVQYTQKAVPGYLVSFTSNGKAYTVNVGENRAVVCERINDYMIQRKKRADTVLKAHREARLDLAQKLGVDPNLVKVEALKIETWEDSSLGCPQPDQEYNKGPVEGIKISMSCRDKQYEYRVPLEGGDFRICSELISCHETM